MRLPFSSLVAWVLLQLLTSGCQSAVTQAPGAGSSITTTASGGAGFVGTTGVGGTTELGESGTGGASAAPAAPVERLKPGTLVCAPGGVDPAGPRRVIRLAPSEFIGSLKAAIPVDPASTSGFDTSVLGETPKSDDAVSKDWHTKADAVARASAGQASASPAGLGCGVAEFGVNAACTSSYLESMARKVFRGRVDAEDVSSLASLAAGVAARSDGKTAFEIVIRALALSPESIYLTEGMDRSVAATLPASMGAAEMASFISFRIAKQPPSESLLQALSANPSLDYTALTSLLDREFTPDQFARGATDFLAAWLNVAALTGNITKDPIKHATFTRAFLGELQKETYDTFYTQFLAPGNGDLRTLLTANVESALLQDSTNPSVQMYKRPGVMAMPGFIASISAPEHTDLPKRGKFLVNAFFCEGQQPPPPGISFPDAMPGQSQRQKFEMIEALGGCGGCHTRINPLAYPMERYDEVGNPRALDDGMNIIDTSGAHAIIPLTPRDFTFTDMADLGTKMAQEPYVHSCVSIQAFEYVTRRSAASPTNPGRNDSCTVSAISNAATANGFKLTDLLRDSLVRTALSPRAD